MGIRTAASKAAVRQAYDIDRFRESLLIQGLLPIIPPRPNRTVPEHPAFAGARGGCEDTALWKPGGAPLWRKIS